MKYDLKDPFEYIAGKTCEAIEFRQPKGKESQHVYNLLGALTPLAEGKIPEHLAEKTLSFVDQFGSIVGDADIPISEVSGHISSRDILELANGCVEAFT